MAYVLLVPLDGVDLTSTSARRAMEGVWLMDIFLLPLDSLPTRC